MEIYFESKKVLTLLKFEAGLLRLTSQRLKHQANEAPWQNVFLKLYLQFTCNKLVVTHC